MRVKCSVIELKAVITDREADIEQRSHIEKKANPSANSFRLILDTRLCDLDEP